LVANLSPILREKITSNSLWHLQIPTDSKAIKPLRWLRPIAAA
jgi:hypothetical protein